MFFSEIYKWKCLVRNENIKIHKTEGYVKTLVDNFPSSLLNPPGTFYTIVLGTFLISYAHIITDMHHFMYVIRLCRFIRCTVIILCYRLAC